MQLADSEHKDFAYKKLLSLGKQDGDGLMYWTGRPDQEAKNESVKVSKAIVSGYLKLPDSLQVESTSYSLITQAMRSDLEAGIPTLRWLISKQNSNGGFASTQDTVIGLQALGAIADKISTDNLKMDVSVKHGSAKDGEPKETDKSFDFTPDNAMVLQQIELKPDAEWVQVEATGFGSAIVQVSYQYNIADAAEKPAFALSANKGNTNNENDLLLNVCTS